MQPGIDDQDKFILHGNALSCSGVRAPVLISSPILHPT